jgi:hypothetical protein
VFYSAIGGPTVAALGPDSGRFFNHVVRRRKAMIFFLVVSTLTVVAGGFLYWRDSGGLGHGLDEDGVRNWPYGG